MKASVYVIWLLAMLIIGCGGGETTTVIERETVTEQAPEARERPSRPRTPPPESEPAPSEPKGGDINIPDVVGEDHQLAQDTLQATGLYALREEDSTGQDRALLFDRNWVVERQEPPAGSEVTADTTITLFSKMEDE